MEGEGNERKMMEGWKEGDGKSGRMAMEGWKEGDCTKERR
jgi:hypothetical protein